jgi:hypothetical protein
MSEQDPNPSEYLPYDPEGSPWVAQAIEGMPFAKDSEEMRAINRILERRKRREEALAPRSE